MVVPGAIAATCAAIVIKTPAEPAVEPLGMTFDGDGSGFNLLFFNHVAPGCGSTFAIDVPRAPIAPVPGTAARRGLAGRRVLVVDNEAPAREALGGVLRGWGCDVVAVADGAGASASLVEGSFDLWIFDYHLDAGDDGVALHARLAGRVPPAPCMLLSADQTGAVRAAAQEAGLPLLMKPLRPLALKSMLDRMLAARGSEFS